MKIQCKARLATLAVLLSGCLSFSAHAETPDAGSYSYYAVGPDLFVVKSEGNKVAVSLCRHTDSGITRCSRNWSRIDTGGDSLKFVAAEDILYIIREASGRQFLGSCLPATTGVNSHCSGWKEISPSR